MDINQTSFGSGMRPREPRRNVLIQGRMRCGGARTDICVRNISARGLLAQAAAPPERGTYVEIFLARHTIVGRVIWTKDRRFGIQTQERLDVEAIIKEAALRGSAPEIRSAVRPSAQRRSDSRRLTAADVAQRLDRSRRISAALEFGCIVACAAASAAITVSIVVETLSRPIEHVGSHIERVE